MILTLSKIFSNTPKSVSNWKNENRPVISLLYKYFSKDNLEEFLKTGKIDKYDGLLQIQEQVITSNANKYINTFLQKTDSNTLKFTSPYFIDFYFNFLSNFNTFEKNKKFSSTLNGFFIDYIIDKHEYQEKLKEISQYLFFFNDWDELMSIFLNQNVDKNLSILLYETNDTSLNFNRIKIEEIYFHIIGLYVYSNYSSLKSYLKIELIKNLHDKVRDEFYTYDLLIQYIKEVEISRIEVLTELGFDKSLY